MGAIDPSAPVNLSKAVVLIVEGSQHSVDVTTQIMKGFGVAEVHRCLSTADAEKITRSKTFDLILIDPGVGEGSGYTFLRTLRHTPSNPNVYAPVMMISGHVRTADVARARDVGANFFLAKPLTPAGLLQRIMFIARDKRPFIEAGGFVGPDRRSKFEGPPQGSEGRRASDRKAPLGEAEQPNMSQNEIDMMIRPQRVVI